MFPIQLSPGCARFLRLSSLVFLSLIVSSHSLWHLVNPSQNYSNLGTPLCLPVTQTNSKNRHNYSLISWAVMWRACWNILYPLIFPQGGTGGWEHWLNAPNRGRLSSLESRMFQHATSLRLTASLSANIGIFIKTAKSIIFHFVISFLSGHDLLIDDFVFSPSSITVPQLSS